MAGWGLWWGFSGVLVGFEVVLVLGWGLIWCRVSEMGCVVNLDGG